MVHFCKILLFQVAHEEVGILGGQFCACNCHGCKSECSLCSWRYSIHKVVPSWYGVLACRLVIHGCKFGLIREVVVLDLAEKACCVFLIGFLSPTIS